MARPVSIPPISKEELEVLYKENTSYGIGEILGRSQETIRCWLHKYNIPLRKKGDPPNKERDRFERCVTRIKKEVWDYPVEMQKHILSTVRKELDL